MAEPGLGRYRKRFTEKWFLFTSVHLGFTISLWLGSRSCLVGLCSCSGLVGGSECRPVSGPAGRLIAEGGRPPHAPLLALTDGEDDNQEVGGLNFELDDGGSEQKIRGCLPAVIG